MSAKTSTFGGQDEALSHPSVIPESARLEYHGSNRHLVVDVACPQCDSKRTLPVADIRRKIKDPKRKFTGHCKACTPGSLNWDNETIPIHPSIISNAPTVRIYKGKTRNCIEVECPECKTRRWTLPSIATASIANGTWTGCCLKCSRKRPHEKSMRSGRNPEGKLVNKGGYVCLTKNFIKDEELDLWYTLKGKKGNVPEHRWVMSKHLGRPLESWELVDHMDGDKKNNSIENLRVYVKGNQDPGSAPGYGTFYHEWQETEAEIRRLESLMSSIPVY